MSKSNNLNYRLKYDLISLKVTDFQICNFFLCSFHYEMFDLA